MEQFFEVVVRENNSGALVFNVTTTDIEKLDIDNLNAGLSYIATGILLLSYTKQVLLHELSKKTGWYHYHRTEIEMDWRGVVGLDERVSPPPSLFVDWAVSLYTVQSLS